MSEMLNSKDLDKLSCKWIKDRANSNIVNYESYLLEVDADYPETAIILNDVGTMNGKYFELNQYTCDCDHDNPEEAKDPAHFVETVVITLASVRRMFNFAVDQILEETEE